MLKLHRVVEQKLVLTATVVEQTSVLTAKLDMLNFTFRVSLSLHQFYSHSLPILLNFLAESLSLSTNFTHFLPILLNFTC